jgi:excisionase family DNA binding protein
MAPSLNLTQAAKLLGISRNTLYAAIRTGRLVCVMGGRPGTKTLVTLEALRQAGYSLPEDVRDTERTDERPERPERPERLQRPERAERAERLERFERSAADDLERDRREVERTVDQFERAVERLERAMDAMVDRLGERLERSVERALERALERVIERVVERRAREAVPAVQVRPLEPFSAKGRSDKPALLARLRTMEAQEPSLEAIANKLNAEGVPTLSGRGKWHKGTIGNLLREGKTEAP